MYSTQRMRNGIIKLKNRSSQHTWYFSFPYRKRTKHRHIHPHFDQSIAVCAFDISSLCMCVFNRPSSLYFSKLTQQEISNVDECQCNEYLAMNVWLNKIRKSITVGINGWWCDWLCRLAYSQRPTIKVILQTTFWMIKISWWIVPVSLCVCCRWPWISWHCKASPDKWCHSIESICSLHWS